MVVRFWMKNSSMEVKEGKYVVDLALLFVVLMGDNDGDIAYFLWQGELWSYVAMEQH